MKLYIMINTKLRRTAKKNFQMELFTIMNSIIFGKTMKNIKRLKQMD